MTRNSRYTLGKFLLDALLVTLTGGLWLIWIIIREFQNFN